MKKSIYRQQLDELNGEQNEPKKDKKKKKKGGEEPAVGKKNILRQFNEKKAKGDLQTTALKTIADIAGVGIWTVLSAAAGKAAPILGAALIGGGHYVGDESGLMRTVGASTFAHSIAKAKEYRENPNQSIKDRLSNLKDEWLIAFLLKHYDDQNVDGFEPQAIPPTTNKAFPDLPDLETTKEEHNHNAGEIDLSGLDQFDQMNVQAAEDYQNYKSQEDAAYNYSDNSYSELNYRYDPDADLRSWPPKKRDLDLGYNWYDDGIDFSQF